MYQLKVTESFPFVEDAAERHVRLCHLSVGGEKYALLIKEPLDDYIIKLEQRKHARKLVSSANDACWFFHKALGNVIRKVQGRAKEYDREHIGGTTATFIFPNGNITGITRATLEKQPVKASEVVQKIIALGIEHLLYPLAAEIKTAIDNCNAKLKLRDDAEKTYKDAVTFAELAKVKVINQYNATYFSAASEVNKEYAENLFPRLHQKKKHDDNE